MKIDGIEMPFRYVCGSPDGWPTDKPGNSPFSKYVCELCGGEIEFQEFGTFPLERLDQRIRDDLGFPRGVFPRLVFHFQNCPARNGKGRGQTGRTTRMLKHARELSKQLRAVYIVAANEQHAALLRRELGDEPHGIEVETESSLGNLDWQTLTLRGAHHNCVVLVDHYAIESKFSRLLEMLTRYDVSNQEVTMGA